MPNRDAYDPQYDGPALSSDAEGWTPSQSQPDLLPDPVNNDEDDDAPEEVIRQLRILAESLKRGFVPDSAQPERDDLAESLERGFVPESAQPERDDDTTVELPHPMAIDSAEADFAARGFIPDFIGKLDRICPYCHARTYSLEFDYTRFLCCRRGQVQLQHVESDPRLDALIHEHSPRGRQLREHLRSYNSAFAMASFCAQRTVPFTGGGPKYYKIQGQVYHLASTSLAVGPDEGAQFGQIYFLDPSEMANARHSFNDNCRPDTCERIDAVLRPGNRYMREYRRLRTLYDEEQADARGTHPSAYSIVFHQVAGHDPRTHNAPIAHEFAACFVTSGDDGLPANIELRVFPRSSRAAVRLRIDSPSVDPMCFPLLLTKGQTGWAKTIPRYRQNRIGAAGIPAITQSSQQRVSTLQFYAHRLAARMVTLEHDVLKMINPVLCMSTLTQQFVVHAYVVIEENRLWWISTHQSSLHVASYQSFQNYLQCNQRPLAPGEETMPLPGSPLILPSSFLGGARWYHGCYLESMTLIRRFGKPDLFVTVTTNPNWKEIREAIEATPLAKSANDVAMLATRVFYTKLRRLVEVVMSGRVFGPVVAYTLMIEFQKRGLPHAHILFTLDEEHHIRTPEDVDRYISAELPNPIDQPDLYAAVTSFMLHGPHSATSACLEDGVCKKGFPKPFSAHTAFQDNGYPVYRRRPPSTNDHLRFPTPHQSTPLDNSSVVPYSPLLLLMFDCHICVEVCSSIDSIKYVVKYTTKGADRGDISLRPEGQAAPPPNEVQDYLHVRYLGAMEAAWRINELPLQALSHTVVWLQLHLPGQHPLVYNPQSAREAAESSPTSKLMTFFLLFRGDEPDEPRLYLDVPEFYTWQAGARRWERRRRSVKAVGLLPMVSPANTELYHLRLLLLHRPGPSSFDDLRTIDGHRYDTFVEAAVEAGLTDRTDEVEISLREAAAFMMPPQLRLHFVLILINENPPDVPRLLETFRVTLSEDFVRNLPDFDPDALLFHELERLLARDNRSCTQFGIQRPPAYSQFAPPTDDERRRAARDPALRERLREMVAALNDEQRCFYDRVLLCLDPDDAEQQANCLFLDGPGGTGKTFVYNCISTLARARGIPVLAVAWTGIAALLLPDGRTSHRAFGIPLDCLRGERSTLTEEQRADLQRIRIVIWDEASMVPAWAIEWVDRRLRALHPTRDRPFGGVIMVMGGDFRQTLPVLPHGSHGAIVQNCLKRSSLCTRFAVFHLHRNMRVRPEEVRFKEWLLQVGSGVDEFVTIPPAMRSRNLIRDIFGSATTPEDFASRVILSGLNSDVLALNERVLEEFNRAVGGVQADLQVLFSTDTITSIHEGEAATEAVRRRIPIESVHSRTPTGLPPHALRIRKGAVVMLIRNLSFASGLCNGARFVVREIRPRSLLLAFLDGARRDQGVYIPRITLKSEGRDREPYVIHRRQFPVRLAYSITVNKSQGQTFDRVGILLENELFAHGQLYVALSRCRSESGIKVQSPSPRVRNVVYREVLGAESNETRAA